MPIAALARGAPGRRLRLRGIGCPRPPRPCRWAAVGHGSALPDSQAGPRPPGQRSRKRMARAPSQKTSITSDPPASSTALAPTITPTMPMNLLSTPARLAFSERSTNRMATIRLAGQAEAADEHVAVVQQVVRPVLGVHRACGELVRQVDGVHRGGDPGDGEHQGTGVDQVDQDGGQLRPAVPGYAEEVPEHHPQGDAREGRGDARGHERPRVVVDGDQPAAVALARIGHGDGL